MANSVYIATSLDGFIARKDGNLDWLMEIPNPENNDFGFSLFMERMDGILMGRNTFETVVGFGEWPYTRPVFVLSNTLQDIPAPFREKATLVRGELEDILDTLQKKGIRNLYIDGGKTIRGFLEKGLIDELIITRVPILLGSGIPLFVDMDAEVRFRHVSTDIFSGQLVKSTYIKVPSE